MYKWLLCWRYLRTRYLAMACIVSVMLGVATLIVVNTVMGGFSTKLKDRLHGLLSDIVIEAHDYNGFAGYEREDGADPLRPVPRTSASRRWPRRWRSSRCSSSTTRSFSGAPIARPIRLIGIDPESRTRVGGFAEHLLRTKDNPTFQLSPEVLAAPARPAPAPTPGSTSAAPEPPLDLPTARSRRPSRRRARSSSPRGRSSATPLAYYRDKDDREEEVCMLQPGDDVIITTISGQKMQPVYARFAVVDYFKSEMSEYDSRYVFVPLDYLQKLRTMEGKVTSIQIRLKNGDDYQTEGGRSG